MNNLNINITPQNNTVVITDNDQNQVINITPQNNTVVITDNDQNQVVIENPIISVVEVIVTADEQNQIIIDNPVTSIVEIISEGPQGPPGPIGPFPNSSSFVTTSSFNNFTSSYNTGSFSGSFQGTSSYSNNSLSSSYSLTSSYLLNSPDFNTGSLVTTSSFNLLTSSFNSFTSSYNTGSFSGLFQGTSSYSSQTLSSSYALTASYALNAGTTVNTSSFVTTSSFNSFTSSYNTGSFTGSFRGTFTGSLQGTSSYSSQTLSSSYSLTSSFTIGGELQSNKSNDIYMGGINPSSIDYPSEYAVNYFVSQSIAAAQAGIPLLEIDMFANYKLFEYDENGSTSYQGQTKYNNNAWLITKYLETGGDITATYANVSNNGSYTAPSTAWTARAVLNYTSSIANLTGI